MGNDTIWLGSLIQKLEQATEGSRELDLAISDTARGTRYHEIKETMLKECFSEDGDALGHDYAASWGVLPYTKSLDAALTLVPIAPVAGNPRMMVQLELYSNGRGNACVHHWDNRLIWSREQATPALALCMAALKASEHQRVRAVEGRR